jgi:hypothetical protein
MRKFINSVKNKATKAYIAGKTALAAKKGEGYIDTALKIIIGVVIGGVILAALYTLFDSTIMPTLETKIDGFFEYSGT